MIDLFSLGITHALMLLALWRLATRGDGDAAEGPRRPWGSGRDA